MKNICTITKTFNINLDANQWCLYTATLNCEQAAKELNETLNMLLNMKVSSYKMVLSEMDKIMTKWNDYGANDSEPRQVLYDILEEIYKWDEQHDIDGMFMV